MRWALLSGLAGCEVIAATEQAECLSAVIPLGTSDPGESHLSDVPCRCWTGTAIGNDDLDTRLELCFEGEEASGRFSTSSPASGESVRRVEGVLTEGLLMLEDVAFELSAPNPGWTFCPIDQYRLEDLNGVLVGRYWSSECGDCSELNLVEATCSDR